MFLENKKVVAEIPEVKDMIDCAKRFLAGETNIHELHGQAQQCKNAAHLFGNDSAVLDLASEWVTMSYRYWNEWGDAKDPLTEDQFKMWLNEQINVF